MKYPIYYGGIDKKFAQWMSGKAYTTIFVLTDTNTNELCLPYFLQSCRLSDAIILTIPSGELHKNISTCVQVWEDLQRHHADRRSLLVLLGGGVVGDLGGFCAATYMRGIDFVQVPTSLLAMTDSSVGGKTGVDVKHVKNMVGCFAAPKAVFLDVKFLATLPLFEWKSGFAEVLKHGFIGNPGLFEVLCSITDLSKAPWGQLLRTSVEVKATIVRQDPYELGLRKLLNFGHTVGHAIESYSLGAGEPRSHGACVAVGMMLEYHLAYLCENDENINMHYHQPRYDALKEVFSRFYEMPKFGATAAERLWELMRHDKKNAKGEVVCVVPGEHSYSMRQIFPNKLDFYKLISESNV